MAPRYGYRKGKKSDGSWVASFEDFCSRLMVSSKEEGLTHLDLYGSQREFLRQIGFGLDRGIRHFVCLKARQLGISTVSLAIDLFWLFTHPGLQGALVTDTESNRDAFRMILSQFMACLPVTHRVGMVIHNRNQLHLRNGSTLHYLVAGTSGRSGLGRGRGLNFVHATECSSWRDMEGLASLMASLAVHAKDRLFIFESTARGFNLFKEMYETAIEASDQHACFISWAHHEGNALEKNDPRFKDYFGEGWTAEEREKATALKEQHGVVVSDEQLAWYRMTAKHLVDENLGLIEQEFPWTASEAFITTGSPFFSYKILTEQMQNARAAQFKAYRYSLGADWLATRVDRLSSTKGCELRIWEEPDRDGVYAVGADPAGGNLIPDASRYRDRFAIQILRCYADRTVLVAEYCSTDATPFQFAWVLAHLCGAYKNCRVILEVNGVGAATYEEIKNLRQQITSGYLSYRAKEMKLSDVLDDMTWYLYHRQDSLGSGYLLNWKTSAENKREIMLQLRDSLIQKAIDVRSVQCIEEMQSITYTNASIGTEGRVHDDRVFALAFAHKAWVQWLRLPLSEEGRTYAHEQDRLAQRADAPQGQSELISYIVQDYFEQRRLEREQAEEAQFWGW